MRLAGVAVAIVVLMTQGAGAQNAGDAASGRRLAQQWCAECHAIAPNPPRGPNPAAPAFAELAADPAMTPARIRAVFRAPHRSMPATALTESQIDDVVAFIASSKQ